MLHEQALLYTSRSKRQGVVRHLISSAALLYTQSIFGSKKCSTQRAHMRQRINTRQGCNGCVCVCANRDECMESQQLSREALRGALYCAVVTAHDSAVPAGANLGCPIVMTIDEATTHHFIHIDWTNHTTPPSEEPHAHRVKRTQYSVSLTPPTCTPPGTSTTHLPFCSRRRMLCRVIGRMPHHQYS